MQIKARSRGDKKRRNSMHHKNLSSMREGENVLRGMMVLDE